jgi:hypothetical protein
MSNSWLAWPRRVLRPWYHNDIITNEKEMRFVKEGGKKKKKKKRKKKRSGSGKISTALHAKITVESLYCVATGNATSSGKA